MGKFPEVKGHEMPEVVLQTEKLTKRFGPLVAVQDLNLEVYQGEVFGFLGPNGAGKTTSINMMCGLLKPDAGRVLLHGKPLTSGDGLARSRVGVCPQEVALWERLTCLEQLQFIGQMYGLKSKKARQRGVELLEVLDLAEKRDKQARTLSGGMKRRLNLAMALVHDPEIVVLDEPEAGLDPQSRLSVREYIQFLARQKTIILTTHNMDEAERLADRVAIINRGRLLVLDTPEALKARVGEGDVLEITLDRNLFHIEKLTASLTQINSSIGVDQAHGALILRGLNLVNLLPKIMEALAAQGIKSGEVRLRANTLEDVFIQLTGRKLRE
jgi:ABC-2 type transport system ATP-binding protein